MLNGGRGGPLVVGVLAPRVELYFPRQFNVERAPDLWLANRLAYDNAQRNNVSLRVVARLKPGTSLDHAQSQVARVAAELRKNFVIKETAGFEFRLEPMQKYLTEDVRSTILALAGAVMFLLLIACANVANLLLVR